MLPTAGSRWRFVCVSPFLGCSVYRSQCVNRNGGHRAVRGLTSSWCITAPIHRSPIFHIGVDAEVWVTMGRVTTARCPHRRGSRYSHRGPAGGGERRAGDVAAPGDARNATASATSSGCAARSSRVVAPAAVVCSGGWMLVYTGPEATVLMRTPLGLYPLPTLGSSHRALPWSRRRRRRPPCPRC